jgi:4-amino-4-deoxy-L-arabinose transferase-like glycosyltransferase
MSKKHLFLIGFILLKFVLQWVLLSPEYDLQRDEFLHLDQANHLAWGYLSVPPVTSWISTIIQFLGNSIFWVKFFPALFGALTIIVVWRIIETLNGNLFALLLGATDVLFSVLLRLNTLYQPNSLDVLCWTTFYFIVIKYLQTKNAKWFFLGVVVFAIGFLNKYNMIFVLVGLAPAMLLTSQRIIFKRSSLYLALLFGLLLVSPNLFWQYEHGIPVIGHLTTLRETQLINTSPLDFVRSQLLFFFGSLPVIIGSLYALWAYSPFKKYRPFFWGFWITLLVFLLLKAKDYYAIGLYPSYIAFGAVYLANTKWVVRYKNYLQPFFISLPLLFFILMYHFVFPNKSPQHIINNNDTYQVLGLLRWEDGEDHAIPQDFADMLGWKELAEKVDLAYENMPEPEKTLVLCDNYGQAGAINYYSKAGVRASSFNADYIHWFDLSKPYTHLIRIKNSWERENELIETSPYFEHSIIADSVTNEFAREYGTTIFIFQEAKININERIASEIQESGYYR